jgi:hypothetical protein
MAYKNFNKHIALTEAVICETLIDSILRAGYVIELHDGEEVSLPRSRDRAALQEWTAISDLTSYIVFDDDGNRIGSFVLIHGNGEDILSDFSWPASKPENEAIMESLQRPISVLLGYAEPLPTDKPALEYPREVTPELLAVLCLPMWNTGPIATIMRAGGAMIPRKSELEQAHVLHWLVTVVLEHGEGWKKFVMAEMERMSPSKKPETPIQKTE